jgi:Uma2 family endonuclease
MAMQPKTGLTYDDLLQFPEDLTRRELIGGELIVTAAPATRHQDVVVFLVTELELYRRQHGGKVLSGPVDVFFTDRDVVEPDVVFVRPENMARVEPKMIRSSPDLIVEVSSPSTRRVDQVRKRDLYERFGVPEFWFIDLEADRVEVHALESGSYGKPALRVRGETLESPLLPGLSLAVDELLGTPAED